MNFQKSPYCLPAKKLSPKRSSLRNACNFHVYMSIWLLLAEQRGDNETQVRVGWQTGGPDNTDGRHDQTAGRKVGSCSRSTLRTWQYILHVPVDIRCPVSNVVHNLLLIWPSPSGDCQVLSGMWEFRFQSDFRLFCSSQNSIFRLLMHWKAHLSGIADYFRLFQAFFSQTLSHPCFIKL